MTLVFDDASDFPAETRCSWVHSGDLYKWKPYGAISAMALAAATRASFGARNEWRSKLDPNRMARLFAGLPAFPPLVKPTVEISLPRATSCRRYRNWTWSRIVCPRSCSLPLTLRSGVWTRLRSRRLDLVVGDSGRALDSVVIGFGRGPGLDSLVDPGVWLAVAARDVALTAPSPPREERNTAVSGGRDNAVPRATEN